MNRPLKRDVLYNRPKQNSFYLIMSLKFNLKILLLCLCSCVVFFLFWTSKCGDFVAKIPRKFYSSDQSSSIEENIDCIINSEYSVGCKKKNDEIYMPFSFIKKYFEVYGSLNSFDGTNRFEFSHSFGKINHPKHSYDPRGIFMYFENYNVETRDRVKCISAIEHVPITTQWDRQGKGWFYTTQIAQFGLSHYSKNLTDPDPRRRVIEDVELSSINQTNWIISKDSTMTRTYSAEKFSNIINFKTSNQFNSSISITNLEFILDLVLSVDILFYPNSSLLISLENRETRRIYNLYYIFADFSISVQDQNIYYGVGTVAKWNHLTRDLFIDLQKGMQSQHYFSDHKRKIRRTELKIVSMEFRGNGSFDNITISSSEHLQHFYDSADWLLRNQNTDDGGWPIRVKRKLGPGFQELQKGWYSAMSQGHAISTLSRAFYQTGDSKYLSAAINALKPFRVPSHQGGVMATFLGKFVWYEEYPTHPSSFVLNGFIYSLIGLYDLYKTAPREQGKEAKLLFDQGMFSLKKMLAMYDTGSGTVYDLRHIFLSGCAPNLARWDYHSTHVNQLLVLATIDNDPVITETAERWKNYMFGKRAEHN